MRIAPSVGDGSLLPSATNVNEKSQESSGAAKLPRVLLPSMPPEERERLRKKRGSAWPAAADVPAPFTVELIRPALPDGGAAVRWYGAPTEAVHGLVLVGLVFGQPCEVWLDGRQVLCEAGDGWQGHVRAVVTIRGLASPAMRRLLGILTPVEGACGAPSLYVPFARGQLCEILCDGQPVVHGRDAGKEEA